jgi:hypothetical protein
MSHEPSHSSEHLPPPELQAEEAISWVKVIAIAVSAVVIFTLSVLLVLRMLNSRERALQPFGPDPLPRQVGQTEIGLVDQVPFDVYRGLQAYRNERLQRLEGWGWVDRKQGTVHMPIEEAMDQVVREQRR